MEIKKIENCDYVMRVGATSGYSSNNPSPMSWPTCNYPSRRQSLIRSLASAWARTDGANTSRAIFPSSVSLQDTTQKNSHQSTPTL